MFKPLFCRSLLACLSLSLTGQWVQAADPINYTVTMMVDSSREGPDRPRPFFTMGAKRIAFKKPQQTEMSSASDSLSFYLSKPGVSGQFSVVNSSFSPEVDFINETQRYFDAGEATLPSGKENVTFQGADFKVYAVSGHSCISLEWTYNLFGRPTRRQVAFINIDATHQVCLTTVAEEEHWSDVAPRARQFINSWYGVDEVKGTFDSLGTNTLGGG